MKTNIPHRGFLFLVSLFFVLILAEQFSGPTWQNKSAADKFSIIWSKITGDTSSGTWPSTLEQAKLFIEDLNTSFDAESDDFPNQGPFGIERRQKLVHSVGLTGQIRWRSLGNHNYTGLFTGSNYGLVRLSWSGNVDLSKPYPYGPGGVFKFFRSGMKSANLFTQTTLIGVETPNIFYHDLTNHIPMIWEKTTDVKLLLIQKAFSKASVWTNFVGLSDFAGFDESGNKVTQLRFPYRVIFHCPPDVRALMDRNASQPQQDLVPFFLSNLNRPLPLLYSVFAEAQPGAKAVKIGEVELVSAFVPSVFSDKYLFFQHVRFDEDLKYHPEWVGPAKAELAQQAQNTRYIYPNQPDN